MSTGSMNALEHGPQCDSGDSRDWCPDCLETAREDRALEAAENQRDSHVIDGGEAS